MDMHLTLASTSATVERGDDGLHLVLPFGSKVPCQVSGVVPAGGNAANASVACARLGLRVGLATYVGDDTTGRDALAALAAEGVDLSFAHQVADRPTNRNFILRVGHERTILVDHEQHECHWRDSEPTDLPAWIYLSSVGRDAHGYEDEIADWLESNPQVDLAFAPGSLQVARGAHGLARLYQRAGVVICNRQEAATITGQVESTPVTALADAMLALGSQRVAITDGSAGAYGAETGQRWRVPIYPDPTPVVDRTGAGDAFAGTLVAGLAGGLALEEALLRAPINSMSVVQAIGTQSGLLSRDRLEHLLDMAPPEFTVEPIV